MKRKYEMQNASQMMLLLKALGWIHKKYAKS
jgi:hypothetical protein